MKGKLMSVDVEEVTTTEVVPSQLAQDLTAALARLDRQGWVQCNVGTPDGAGCILGHLTWLELEPERVVRVARALRNGLPFGVRGLAYFNDSPTTTLADVRGLFVRAIEAS